MEKRIFRRDLEDSDVHLKIVGLESDGSTAYPVSLLLPVWNSVLPGAAAERIEGESR